MRSSTFRNAFKAFWRNWQAKKQSFDNVLVWWDMGKVKMKELAQEISRSPAKDRKLYCLDPLRSQYGKFP